MPRSVNISLFLVGINLDSFGLGRLHVARVHRFRVAVVLADDRRVLQVELGDDVETGSLREGEKLCQEEQNSSAEDGVLGTGQAPKQICRKF